MLSWQMKDELFGELNSPKEDVMSKMRNRVCGAAIVAAILGMLTSATWASADIIDEWTKVVPPPVPELKAVTLSGATTAVIIGDMNQTSCLENPRCAATVPVIKKLAEAGRVAGAMFWYSVGGGAEEKTDMVDTAFNPREDSEWERINGPDKFRGSHLEEKLKARNVKTAIVCGHSFQGVGIGTATGLALRGIAVVIPVDCLASNNPYATYLEQYSVWHLYKSGNGVANHVTITRGSMISFQK
jgi:nicotinamidase-related amidase